MHLLAYENVFKLVSSQRKIKQYGDVIFPLSNGQNIKKALLSICESLKEKCIFMKLVGLPMGTNFLDRGAI